MEEVVDLEEEVVFQRGRGIEIGRETRAFFSDLQF